jgi:hypothetical protein
VGVRRFARCKNRVKCPDLLQKTQNARKNLVILMMV